MLCDAVLLTYLDKIDIVEIRLKATLKCLHGECVLVILKCLFIQWVTCDVKLPFRAGIIQNLVGIVVVDE